MNKFKAILCSNYYFILYTFAALAFDFFFEHTRFIGAIFLLVIPLWGIVFVKKSWGKLNPLHYVSIILCTLITLLLFFHDNDIVMYWCFGLKTWCFILVITTAEPAEQDKIYVFILKLFVLVALAVQVLTVASFVLVAHPRVLELLPEYFQRLMQKSAILRPRLVGYCQNANGTAIISMIGIFCAVCCIVYLKQWRLISIATICSSSIVIFLTNSRGSMLSVCVFVCLFLVFFLLLDHRTFTRSTKKKLLLGGVFFLIFIVAFILIFLYFHPFQNFICSRFLRIPVNPDRTPLMLMHDILAAISSGSGRDVLMKINMEQFKQNPMFGISVAALSDNYERLPTHNGFLFALFTLGIPIFAVYIVLLGMLISPSIKAWKYRDSMNKRSNMLLALIYSLILTSFLENTYEVVLLFVHNLENSFYFSIYVLAYIIGNRILSEQRLSS